MLELESFIKSVPLFKSLSASDIRKVSDCMEKVYCEADTTIFRQGDSGD